MSYLVKARQRRDRLGEPAPGPQRPHTPRKLAHQYDAVAVYAAEHPDATADEYRSWLPAEHGVYASAGLMWNTLDRLGLSLKNRRSEPPKDRADVAEACRVWRELQPQLKAKRLASLDETWTKTNMARLRGRSPRGQRLIAAVPHGHWPISTFHAGLRYDRIVVPLVLDGVVNGEMFHARIEQFLTPTPAPGDIVIAGNLAAHKIVGVREAIEARWASLLFLPPYSPDLNPIEQLFAKLRVLSDWG